MIGNIIYLIDSSDGETLRKAQRERLRSALAPVPKIQCHSLTLF